MMISSATANTCSASDAGSRHLNFTVCGALPRSRYAGFFNL
jgi:hypothetical protein